MRVVLDVNILVSALIAEAGFPALIYEAWEDGRFTQLSCDEHLAELRATLRKPRVAALIRPHRAGKLVNDLRRFAEIVAEIPRVRRSADPFDDYLLALSEAGRADYLVTGDKDGLLSLRRHKGTKIVSAKQFGEKLWRCH
jgi:putative PIN family toxin of toxin-antitoxin system